MSGPETCGNGSAYRRHTCGVEEPGSLIEDLPSHIAGISVCSTTHPPSSVRSHVATLPSQVFQSSAYTLLQNTHHKREPCQLFTPGGLYPHHTWPWQNYFTPLRSVGDAALNAALAR